MTGKQPALGRADRKLAVSVPPSLFNKLATVLPCGFVCTGHVPWRAVEVGWKSRLPEGLPLQLEHGGVGYDLRHRLLQTGG